jgi:transposase
MADLHTKTKTLMNERRLRVMGDASRGARIATEEVSTESRPAPDPEVAATAKRRQFSSKEKRRILAAADRCTEAGAIGALLRREGIYSSQLATWRRQREASERVALEPRKRGRKVEPGITEARRVAELTKDNERLRRKLAQAHIIIDVQKKLYHQASYRAHQGVSHTRRNALDGLQAGHERREELAPAPRFRMAREGDRRSEVPRWD